jgi:hypothetical protein
VSEPTIKPRVLRSDVLLAGSAGVLLSTVLIVGAVMFAPRLGLGLSAQAPRESAPGSALLPAEAPLIATKRPDARDRRRAPGPVLVARRTGTAQRVVAPPVARRPAGAVTPAPTGSSPGAGAPAAPAPASPASPAPAPAPVPTPAPARPAPPVVVVGGGTVPTVPVLPPIGRVGGSREPLVLEAQSVVVAQTDNGQPEVRVGLNIGGAAKGVPAAITVRLRPDLPAGGLGNGPALALHADLDVVEPVRYDLSSAQLRVRMAVARASDHALSATDGGDGDGTSNVIAVDVPLRALSADDHSGSGSGSGSGSYGSDAPVADQAAGDGSAPADTPPNEVRLDLVAPADPDDAQSSATATVPVPAHGSYDDGADDLAVSVAIDPAPAAADAPSQPAAPAPSDDPAQPATPAPSDDPAPDPGADPASPADAPPTPPAPGDDPASPADAPPTPPAPGDDPASSADAPPTPPAPGDDPASSADAPPTPPAPGDDPAQDAAPAPTDAGQPPAPPAATAAATSDAPAATAAP